MRDRRNGIEQTSAAQPRLRGNSFGLVRILLAIGVIYSHSFAIAGHGDDPVQWALRGKADLGGLAVEFFFAISGFLLYTSYRRSGGPFGFMRNRVLRIYPAYLVSVLICVLVVGAIGASDPELYLHSAISTRSALAAATLGKIPDTGLTYPQLNGSLWTIKIEFEAYIVLAVLGVIGLLRYPRIVLLVWITSVFIYAASLRDLLPAELVRFESHFTFWAYFMTGVTFAAWRSYVPWNRSAAVVSAIVWVAGAVGGAIAYVNLLAGTYLLFRAGLSSGRFAGFATKTDLSYGTYLFGWPVQVLLVAALPASTSPFFITVVAIPVALCVAFASWHIVEQPALRLKHSQSPRPIGAGALPELAPSELVPG